MPRRRARTTPSFHCTKHSAGSTRSRNITDTRVTKARYFAARDRHTQGEAVAGMVWARNFAAHELAVTSDLGDLISDVMTEMVGVLVWRDEVQLPKHDPDKWGRDAHYRTHLEGKPVPDTLLLAREFLTDIITKV